MAGSSWFAAYQKAVDTATNQTQNFREFIAEKQAALGIDGRLEEATKQLRDTVSTVTTTVARTAQRAHATATTNASASINAHNELVAREMAREMAEYGITDEYVEAVRSKLEYGIFRDHKDAQHVECTEERRLNAWQERHVILLMQRVKEVDALRYTLCPKYMDDGVFWSIYFQLVRNMLPIEAYEYKQGESVALPRRYDEVVKEQEGKNPTVGFEYIEFRFREIGERFRHKTDGTRVDTSTSGICANTGTSTDRNSDDTPSKTGTRTTDSTKNADSENVDHVEHLKDYLQETGDDEEEDLDDDELDAYLDTLALSSDEESNTVP